MSRKKCDSDKTPKQTEADFAQSRKCKGCVFAKVFISLQQDVLYCDYLCMVGHKRPIPASACRGWGADGYYRYPHKKSTIKS